MSRLTIKLRALGNCLRFSSSGANWHSKRVLLYVGIMASIYPARRKWLFDHIQSYLERHATDGLLEVSIRPPGTVKAAAIPIVFRVGNRADYQTLWECLGDEIYPAPAGVEVRHVLDGGANLGLFSIWHSKLPALSDVLLVEPDPKNLQLLRRNAATCPQFNIVPAALSGTEGEAFFEPAYANTGHLTGAPRHASSATGFAVACRRVEGLIPSAWNMEHTWLKLDIEGAEYDVINDVLRGELRPAAISMEIHDYPTAGGERLVNELERAGYAITMLDPGSATNACRQITAILSRRESRSLVGNSR